MLFSFQFSNAPWSVFICLLSGKNAFISFICPSPVKNKIKCAIFWKPTLTSLDKVRKLTPSQAIVPVTANLSWNIFSFQTLTAMHLGGGISWTRRWSHMSSYHQQNRNERSVCLFCTSGYGGEFFSSSLPFSANWLRNAQALGDGGITAQGGFTVWKDFMEQSLQMALP